MKKIIASLILFVLVLVPNLHFAAAACANDNVDPAVSGVFKVSSFCSAGDLIATIITMLLGLISLIAVVVIILGGYKYVTSQGNAENAGAARKQITYAVVGLVVAVLAYSVVAIVNNTILSASPASSGASTSGNTTGGTPGASTPTPQQQAAMARIQSGVSIVGNIDPAKQTDSNGDFITNSFVATAHGNIQDILISSSCTNIGTSGRVDVTLKIPLSGGGTSDVTGESPNFDISGDTYSFTARFDNQGIIPSQPYAASGGQFDADVKLTFDGGCESNFTVTRDTSTIYKSGS
ncbi:MAG: hypothetical protein JWO40_203 [Candidatus Doudnabacteria bacterium]|nr:hypothetical protein [Candidatus Doudnabacteria bacterium]